MGSMFGNIMRAAGGAVGTVLRSPVGKMVPYVGTALSIGSALLPSGSSGSLPASPFGGAGPLNGPGGGFAGVSPYAGNRGILRNDANVPDWLKPMVISKGDLRMFARAPRGYVIMHDEKGDPYGMPRALAIQMKMWKPAKKPLLSIRDTSAINRANHVIKKLKTFNKKVQHIANFNAPKRNPAKNIIIERPGPRVIGRKVA